jgi:hypothetical protein
MQSADVVIPPASIPEAEVSEPISPELVLVDPALREALRELPTDRPQLRAVPAFVNPPTSAPMRVVVPTIPARLAPQPAEPAPRFLRIGRRAAALLLVASAGLNVLLIGLAVSDATVSSSPPAKSVVVALPPVSLPTPTAPATTATSVHGTRSQPTKTSPTPPAQRFAASAVERQVLTSIVQAPAGKLPPSLIDPKTGLAKNNLQAVCRPEGAAFSCLVRPVHHRPGEGLVAHFRPNRAGTGGAITWSPYRAG